MTELTDFLSKTPSKSKAPCGFAVWVDSLKPEERDAVYAALDDPSWPTATLTAGLQKFGYPYGKETVRKHRIKDCKSCESV